jgi:hypothetical protein
VGEESRAGGQPLLAGNGGLQPPQGTLQALFPCRPPSPHTCDFLARGIKDWGDLDHHSTDVARWRRDHGRKKGFWSLVPQEEVPTGTSKAAQGDGPGQAASPTASPTASDGPLQPGLW